MTTVKKNGAINKFRLFALIRDKKRPVSFNSAGQEIRFFEWREMNDINLGSKKIPNVDILEVRIEEMNEERKRERYPFEGFP